MGREQKRNRKLVECLQPDRRVESEVFGTRTASEETQPGSVSSGAGTTGTGGAGTSGSGR